MNSVIIPNKENRKHTTPAPLFFLSLIRVLLFPISIFPTGSYWKLKFMFLKNAHYSLIYGRKDKHNGLFDRSSRSKVYALRITTFEISEFNNIIHLDFCISHNLCKMYTDLFCTFISNNTMCSTSIIYA